MVGKDDQAAELATSLLKSKQLTAPGKSECERILAKRLIDEGDTEGGIAGLHRAALVAQQSCNHLALFNAKVQLLTILSDQSGPAAASSILAEARQIATKLGDPQVTARLHIHVAETEAKRGLLQNAKRHTLLARRILTTAPNAHLEACTSNLDMAIAVLRSEFNLAKQHGLHAIELAEQAGAAKVRRAVLGTMGVLFYELGEFERAAAYLHQALTAPPANRAQTSCILINLAQLHMIQGDLESTAQALERIGSLIHLEQDHLTYPSRYSRLTRIQLLTRQGYVNEALARTDALLETAARAGDGLLHQHIQLTKAGLLQQLGHVPASMALIAEAVPGLHGGAAELHAQSEQILACALAFNGDAAGEAHQQRAARVLQAIGNVPRQHELARRWDHAQRAEPSAPILDARRQHAQGARQALHDIAMAFAHATRPDLVAAELLNVITATECTVTARTSVQSTADTEACAKPATTDLPVAERRLSVGFRGDHDVQLVVRPKSNVESVASINAVMHLLASLQEVQRARAEREEKATLWPIEELPIDGERSVISGQMRDLMNYARRIARSKVNVLITGESGTGKEILARAIHDFSDRSGKPFVPFNCTAIPRDLLESQLFGHRRGAFTGADRDHPGLIRSAREGTLFLDEIGELGLDLQPKLLRFLESGEISPLGEPGPMTIDVRIVAATNSHLEDAVRDGRFREDLFYRLNVVRLSIPPLRERRDEIPAFVSHFVARAAAEFGKGDIRVAEETMERLLLYRWPGNVRQLQNEMRRIVALAESGATILPHAISDEILGALSVFRQSANGREISVDLHAKLLPTIARIEGEMITAALSVHDGKVDAAARALGISRKGLYLKRQRLGV